MPDTETKFEALLASDVRYIKERVDSIEKRLENKYVTREEFEPIKKVVYGVIALLGTAFLATLASLVWK